MNHASLTAFVRAVLDNIPADWTRLTTHRLDIYNEEKAKSEFLTQFDNLYKQNVTDTTALAALPTAYDYIRLGHPLSSVLEWMLAKETLVQPEQIISFGSQTMPVLAILRSHLLEGKKTRILHTAALPEAFDEALLRTVYGYDFELLQIESIATVPAFDGGTIFITSEECVDTLSQNSSRTRFRKHIQHASNEKTPIDFHLHLYGHLGSILTIDTADNEAYIKAIQHTRRRETIAMTPADALSVLQFLVNGTPLPAPSNSIKTHKTSIQELVQEITNTNVTPLFASSGLSMQYAIMMGLVHDARKKHPGKAIKFIVPPNCYGGTNDQARRVAACADDIAIVDLPVDGDNDMVQSVHKVLDQIATQDAVPYIIAEIPTNPRVEVPDLEALRDALSKVRYTPSGTQAIDPVFILDQTFCPNVHFLGKADILSSVRAIAYASGSKFPSGGKCTAGYCVSNDKAAGLMEKIEKHLLLCDNEATGLQYELLAEQLPSLNERIAEAYKNTRAFVSYIEEQLPEAKINFVSEELAAQGFTPSVFSLDLPTQGATPEARETYKRELNHRLITMMITQIPKESKYCVSYGQLKGVYWTIPATSTQGTTKESDKDYIARVSLSPEMDLGKHKEVFSEFVNTL